MIRTSLELGLIILHSSFLNPQAILQPQIYYGVLTKVMQVTKGCLQLPLCTV